VRCARSARHIWEIMRRNKLDGTNRVTLRHVAQVAFKAVLFALLFSLIFTSALVAVNNSNFAIAAKGVEKYGRAAQAQDVSSVPVAGVNVASAFNSNKNSTYAAKFGVSVEEGATSER